MAKEAQPVFIHLSFSKRIEIAAIRKLEQVISTGAHSNKHKERIPIPRGGGFRPSLFPVKNMLCVRNELKSVREVAEAIKFHGEYENQEIVNFLGLN